MRKGYRRGGEVRQGMQSPMAAEARSEEGKRAMMEEMARERISDEERASGRRDMMREPLTPGEVSRMGRGMKKGGAVKRMASGGKVRGDGICRVKTKGSMR